ncbi:unnamed protein product [Notodromas monacha]|uniref:TLC domain-containing protein n=1 Tax=Notodromas monacha TaxID=399045 RepID=A0A7R9BIA8_9CRUS|nr:unnamed protein product [Notodromas monacha]CAG0914442.1 unnamed protein product [Notodromas monacha]
MELLAESPPPSAQIGALWIGLGVAFFYGLHVKFTVAAPRFVAKSSASARARWRWANIATSCTHAAITGAGALLSFCWYPESAKNIVFGFTKFGHGLAAFSLGYFLVDSVDLFLNDDKKATRNELFIHHGFILACFGLAVFTGRYVPYAQLALLSEVNSVFLHARQLMLLQGVSKHNLVYRLNSLVNLGTFLTFRLSVLVWMAQWLFRNRDVIPATAFSLGSIALPVIIVMNVILLVRLVNSDYRSQGRTVSKSILQAPVEMDLPAQKWT